MTVVEEWEVAVRDAAAHRAMRKPAAGGTMVEAECGCAECVVDGCYYDTCDEYRRLMDRVGETHAAMVETARGTPARAGGGQVAQ